MEREHLKQDKTIGITRFNLLSKDLNYEFEGKRYTADIIFYEVFKPRIINCGIVKVVVSF